MVGTILEMLGHRLDDDMLAEIIAEVDADGTCLCSGHHISPLSRASEVEFRCTEANGALLIISGAKSEEVAAGWGPRNEELHNLYTSPNIIRVIKSRKTRCVGHEALMEEMRSS
jgi:hypothetical protein